MDTFLEACNNDKLEQIRYIYKYILNSNDENIEIQCFINASLRIKKWFITNNIIINKIKENATECLLSCIHDNEQVCWFIELSINDILKIDIGKNNNEIFLTCCENGYYKTIKLIYAHFLKNGLNIYDKNNYALEITINKGYYIIAKWLLYIDKTNNANPLFIINDKMVFSLCLNRDIYMLNDLYSIIPSTLDYNDIYAKYIGCIGYVPSVFNIRDKFDYDRIKVLDWLKSKLKN